MLLAVAAPVIDAFITYREVLEPHPHDTSNLPAPLSDLSVAFSMAPVRITWFDPFVCLYARGYRGGYIFIYVLFEYDSHI